MPRRAATLIAILAAIGCGGGGDGTGTGPIDPPGSKPVATLVLSAATATLIPQQSLNLAATPRAADGSVVAGAGVSWASNNPGVATVTDGVITALLPGRATITATADGKSASALVTVAWGAVIGPAGGTISADSGRLVLAIPPGALAAPVPIQVRLGPPPVGAAELYNRYAYRLLPDGVQFATPATVTMRYTASAHPDSAHMVVVGKRLAQGRWESIPGTAVDQATGTLSFPLTSFDPAPATLAGWAGRFSSGTGWWPDEGATNLDYDRNNPPYHPGQSEGVLCGACYGYGHERIAFWSPTGQEPVQRHLFVGQSFDVSFTVQDQYGQSLGAEVLHAPYTITWTGDFGLEVAGSGTSARLTATRPGEWFAGARVTTTLPCVSLTGICFNGFTHGYGPAEPLFATSTGYNTTGVTVRVIVERVPVKSVVVTPPSARVDAGAMVQLVATPRDSVDGPLTDRPVAWTSQHPLVATVTESGLVQTHAIGTATIVATSEGITGTAVIEVTGTNNPVATVEVSAPAFTVEVGGTIQFTATARDAQGNIVAGRPVTWTALVPGVASVSTSGLVTGVSAGGPAGIRATIDGISRTRSVTVTPFVPLVHGQVSAGERFVCALRQDASTWCWGQGKSGAMGNGTTPVAQSSPVRVSTAPPFTMIVTGGTTAGVVDPEQQHACGLTGGGQAWCWGGNPAGQLGDGTTTQRNAPVPVTGGLVFTTLSTGAAWRTCGLTSGGAAWCWGNSEFGHGTQGTSTRLEPTLIVNAPPFQGLVVATAVNCGLAQSGSAWCWGRESSGELGTGGALNDLQVQPVEVAGHAFVSLTGGGRHLCGLTSSGAVYCWGDNSRGQLGDGTTVSRTVPTAVAGGVSFTSVHAGVAGTCGIDTEQRAWCWGSRTISGHEIGTPQEFTVPTLVPTTARFTSISVGGFHACGDALDGIRCWGANAFGQLGIGVVDQALHAPVRTIFPP